jgi:hypothetical protein
MTAAEQRTILSQSHRDAIGRTRKAQCADLTPEQRTAMTKPAHDAAMSNALDRAIDRFAALANRCPPFTPAQVAKIAAILKSGTET